jgi:hypothetical protein
MTRNVTRAQFRPWPIFQIKKAKTPAVKISWRRIDTTDEIDLRNDHSRGIAAKEIATLIQSRVIARLIWGGFISFHLVAFAVAIVAENPWDTW